MVFFGRKWDGLGRRRAVAPTPSASSIMFHQLIYSDYCTGRIGCCLCLSSTKMFMKITSNVVINCVFWNNSYTILSRNTSKYNTQYYIFKITHVFICSSAVFCFTFSQFRCWSLSLPMYLFIRSMPIIQMNIHSISNCSLVSNLTKYFRSVTK